ncbi:hypothetical protein Tco_0962307 [Tanacetum coccineum]
MRQLSFEETKLDGEAGFRSVAGSGIESFGLTHDESFGVDDLDLNLNEYVDLNVSQIEIQSELSITQEPIVEEVRTQKPIVEEVIVEDYVSSVEDTEQGNGHEDKSASSDGHFLYDDEGINSTYETQYDVQSSKDACMDDDDDEDDDFLVDEENEIVKPDVDVHLFGISMYVPFDNIGATNLVPYDVLEEEDVDVINAEGFDSNLGNDNETSNYKRKRLAELSREIEGVINVSGQWKYSFYSGQEFTTTKEANDKVYMHSIESRTNLKLYKNDSVRVRARCDGKVLVFPMSQDAHDKGDLCHWVLDYVVELQSTNLNTTVKIAVERNTDLSLPTRVFQRIYVCLRALKLSFKACKRELLGLDDAFMKGSFPCQVLTVVGLDLNNEIYPLVYALVEAKKLINELVHARYRIFTKGQKRSQNRAREWKERERSKSGQPIKLIV